MKFKLDPFAPNGLSVEPDQKQTVKVVQSSNGYIGTSGAATPGTGSGTPGGSDTQIQYNSAGSFAGASGLTTNGTDLTITDGSNIITSTTTGTKIGTATTQKVGFHNATPTVQQANSTDIGTVLSNKGLRAVGTNWSASTSGTVNFTGAVKLTGSSSVGQVFTATDTSGTGTWQTSSAGASLTNAASQTTGFSAVAGNSYPCDATAGGFTVTLPTSTGSTAQIAIKKTDSSANIVTISGTINGSVGSISLKISSQGKILIADGAGGWNTLAGDNSLVQLDARYLQVANNLSDVIAATARTNLGLGTLSTLSSINLATNVGATILPLANGGTGSATQNFVDLTTGQTVAGAKVWSSAATFNGGLTIADATDIALNTTTGTKIGTGSTQKIGFFGVTPVAQQSGATDLGTALSNLGLRTVTTTYSLSTTGAVQFNGSIRTSQASISTGTTLTVGTSMISQEADATAAPFTVTLAATTNKGYRFTVTKIDASINAVTLSATSISGAATYALGTQWKSVTVESTGTSGSWRVVASYL